MEDLVNKLHQRIDAMNLEVKDSFREIVDAIKSQDKKINFVCEKTEILESVVHTLQADTAEAKGTFHTAPASPTPLPHHGDGLLPRPPASSAPRLALTVMPPDSALDRPDSPPTNDQRRSWVPELDCHSEAWSSLCEDMLRITSSSATGMATASTPTMYARARHGATSTTPMVDAIPAAPTRYSTTGLDTDIGSTQVMAASPPSRDVAQAAPAPLEATLVSVLSPLAVLGHDRFTPARCSMKCSGNYNSMMMPRFAPCVSPSTSLLLANTHLNTTMPFVGVRVCTGTKGVSTHVLFDEIPEQVEVGWRPWPPPVQVCIRTKERMPWPVPCPSFADDFACWQLKIPWLLLMMISNIVVLSCLVMKLLHQCCSKGLTKIACADPESHVSQSLGNHLVSSGCFLANDLGSPCALWCLEGVPWGVETWWPEIQGVQQWDPGIHLVANGGLQTEKHLISPNWCVLDFTTSQIRPYCLVLQLLSMQVTRCCSSCPCK